MVSGTKVQMDRGRRSQTRCRRPGLVYLNNRYHDPTLGTFISVDPLVTTTGEAYVYGSANPIAYADPTGLFSSCSMVDGEFTCANDLETTEDYWEAAEVHYDLGPENEDPLLEYGSQHWDPHVLAGARAGHNAARMNSEPLPGAGWLAVPLLGPLCVAWCSEGAAGIIGRHIVREGVTNLWNRVNRQLDSDDPLSAFPRAARDSEKPPDFDPLTWRWEPASRNIDEWHWWDTAGGEWRFHDVDKWHDIPHWDFNPWEQWNSPWEHIYPGAP